MSEQIDKLVDGNLEQIVSMSQHSKNEKQTLPTINHYGRIMNTGPENTPTKDLKKYNKKLETSIANDQYQSKKFYEKGIEKLPEIDKGS